MQKALIIFSILLPFCILTACNASEEVVIEFHATLHITAINEAGSPMEETPIKFEAKYNGVYSEYSLEERTDAEGNYLLEINEENLDSRYHELPLVLSEREKYMQADHTLRITLSMNGYAELIDEVVLKDGDNIAKTYILEEL